MRRWQHDIASWIDSVRVGPEQREGETLRQIMVRSCAASVPVLLAFVLMALITSSTEIALGFALVAAVLVLAALEGSRHTRLHGLLSSLQMTVAGLRSDLIAHDYAGEAPRLLGDRLPITWDHGTIGPDQAELLIQLILLKQPGRILEFGPGASTIAMALAVRACGEGHVFALEHAAIWARKVGKDLAQTGLAEHVTIKTSELVPQRMAGKSLIWYKDLDWMAANGPYDLVVVDAPPAASPTDPGREGALYAVWEHMPPGALLVLDDGDREHEIACVQAWQEQYREEIRVEKLALSKGTWLIEKKR